MSRNEVEKECSLRSFRQPRLQRVPVARTHPRNTNTEATTPANMGEAFA